MGNYALEKLASDCVDYGRELAEADIQAMEEFSKYAEEEDDDEDEEEEEKTAAATGEIIADAYWNCLMEKGAEFYGDPDIYIEELQKHAGVKEVGSAVYKGGKKAVKKFWGGTKGVGAGLKELGGNLGNKNARKRAYKTIGAGAKKMGPGLALGAGGAAAYQAGKHNR
ncbi:MAG: hypothetical protein DRQ88_13320 [Epsilonproteobacteria bacterium]|nr:MAG: hypothetical protein DRQ88_13320 [Campylobacterota bacterium]